MRSMNNNYQIVQQKTSKVEMTIVCQLNQFPQKFCCKECAVARRKEGGGTLEDRLQIHLRGKIGALPAAIGHSFWGCFPRKNKSLKSFSSYDRRRFILGDRAGEVEAWLHFFVLFILNQPIEKCFIIPLSPAWHHFQGFGVVRDGVLHQCCPFGLFHTHLMINE